MPLHIRAVSAARRVAGPADSAEPARIGEAAPLRERIAAWRHENPLPPPTGQPADKAFFDDLSGGS